jgi:hypothetical protein
VRGEAIRQGQGEKASINFRGKIHTSPDYLSPLVKNLNLYCTAIVASILSWTRARARAEKTQDGMKTKRSSLPYRYRYGTSDYSSMLVELWLFQHALSREICIIRQAVSISSENLSFHTIARLPMESHMEDNRD